MFISPCGKSFSAIDTLISMGKPRLGESGGAPTASDSLIRRTPTSSTTKNSPVSGMSSCKEGGEEREGGRGSEGEGGKEKEGGRGGREGGRGSEEEGDKDRGRQRERVYTCILH